MDIYDMTVEPSKTANLGETYQNGQKVRITRMVTFSYDVDISDYVDVMGEPLISVETLISEEESENGISYNPDIVRDANIEDDVVISVEVI